VQKIIPTVPLLTESTASGIFSSWVVVQNQKIPLLSRSVLLGRELSKEGIFSLPSSHLILFNLFGHTVAIPTDEAGRVLTVPNDELTPPPPDLSGIHGLLACWTDQNARINPLLDLHALSRHHQNDTDSKASNEESYPGMMIIISPSDRACFEPYITLLNGFNSSVEWLESEPPDDTNQIDGDQGKIIIRALGPVALDKDRPVLPLQSNSAHITLSFGDADNQTPLERTTQYCQGVNLPLSPDLISASIAFRQAISLSFLLHTKKW